MLLSRDSTSRPRSLVSVKTDVRSHSSALISSRGRALATSEVVETFHALRLYNFDGSAGVDRTGHRLASTRRPTDFDPIGMVGVREAEIEGQVALREISRLSVERLENPTPVG